MSSLDALVPQGNPATAVCRWCRSPKATDRVGIRWCRHCDIPRVRANR